MHNALYSIDDVDSLQVTRKEREKEFVKIVWTRQFMDSKNKKDWVKRVIPLELCKRLNFDHTGTWYTNRSESAQENKTCKILGEV